MKNTLNISCCLAVVFVLAAFRGAAAATWHVDSEHGDDAAAGTSPETAWRTLERVNRAKVVPGDKVLFRRGGLWRGTLQPASGEAGNPVTYSWYGEGRKPILQNSVDRSKPSDWTETSPGIWATSSMEGESSLERDIGIFICDHGERWGVKKWCNPDWKVEPLEKPLDYTYDPDKKCVRVRFDGNPAKAFKSIELAYSGSVVHQWRGHDIIYDGLWIRYGGAHGFGGGETRNITIRNCDICWIGGGLQHWEKDKKTGKVLYPVRFGNGIEFWSDAAGHLVERNRLWEIYDAALTNQGNDSSETDIVWRDNVIWNAEYSFEYWNKKATKNIVFEHNTCVDAGYGWAHSQRPDRNGAHVMYYWNRAATTNFVVRNNIFCRATEWTARMGCPWNEPPVHDNNLVWNTGDTPVMRWRDGKNLQLLGWDDYRKLGYDAHSQFAEPKFVDPARRDYRLAAGSPGLTLATDGGPVGARDMPGLGGDQSLVVRPGLKYEIAMMDVSNEAGPNKATIDDYVCLAGWKSYGGLKVMTPSRVTIPLGGGALSLKAEFGVDCRNKVDAPATFRILASDGRVLHKEEGVKKGKSFSASLDLSGLDAVVLEVSGEPGILAGWTKTTTFTYAEGKYPTNDVRVHSPQLGVLTPPERPEPRINGPAVYGVRPGHPIIYRVPVTGLRPVKLKVKSEKLKVEMVGRVVPNAPHSQLFFDPETRVITGSINEPGEYPLTIVASNAKGEARKKITIKVGDRISLTPAMGWNSWNCFGWNVTADDIRNAADALEKSGLAEHGWSYVNVDDYWQNKSNSRDVRLLGPGRDENGRINSNKRFPDMKGLADYIHAKGFRAGLYSSPGPTTCGGCFGSWQHEAQDAKTYADWGFDYLKHDWCSYGSVASGEGMERYMRPYRIMGEALRAQDRDIVYSLCQYGMSNVSTWGAKVGGQSWRVTGDVIDRWDCILLSINKLKKVWRDSAPGEWNDPDMLCIGKMIWNNFAGSRLAPNEQYTHISIWALGAAPLMIGCDMTKFDEFTLSLLRNDEVIAIDQDPLGKAAACIVEKDSYDIWARPLADGSIAVGLFNKGLGEREIEFDMAAAGMEGKWMVRDCWRQKDEGAFSGLYKKNVYGHATHLVRFTPEKGNGERETGKLVIRDIREQSKY